MRSPARNGKRHVAEVSQPFRYETERLILRNWREEDRNPFARLNADADVMRHFPATLARKESDALIDRINAHIEEYGFGLWAVERAKDRTLLGFTGLQYVRFASPIQGDVEIGWRFDRRYWRKGYAREAAEASLGWFWANTDHKRIVSMTIADNSPSWGLMRRLGLKRKPELDFDHPNIEQDSRCCRQIVYAKDRGI